MRTITRQQSATRTLRRVLAATLTVYACAPAGRVSEPEAPARTEPHVSEKSLNTAPDEGSPAFWVEKLDDPAWQARAIARLELFFEDAFTTANKDVYGQEVKGLAEEILDGLVRTYVENFDQLDERIRESLMKLIAAFRDERSVPALNKAFVEFASRGMAASDVRWAARAQIEMKLDVLQEPLARAFDKLEVSTPNRVRIYRDVNTALLAHPSKAWGPRLKAKLEPSISPPLDGTNRERIDEYRNQLFWQVTAAQLRVHGGSPFEPRWGRCSI